MYPEWFWSRLAICRIDHNHLYLHQKRKDTEISHNWNHCLNKQLQPVYFVPYLKLKLKFSTQPTTREAAYLNYLKHSLSGNFCDASLIEIWALICSEGCQSEHGTSFTIGLLMGFLLYRPLQIQVRLLIQISHRYQNQRDRGAYHPILLALVLQF